MTISMTDAVQWRADTIIRPAAKAIGAVAATIVAVGTAWSTWNTLDLPILATRGYVHEQIEKSDKARSAEHEQIEKSDKARSAEIVETLFDLAGEQRDRLVRTRDNLSARLARETDPQAKDDLQHLVDRATKDVAEVETHILALERMRGK